MGFFGAAHGSGVGGVGLWGAGRGWGGGGGRQKAPLPKICHTYPTMVKLDSYTLPKEDSKNI